MVGGAAGHHLHPPCRADLFWKMCGAERSGWMDDGWVDGVWMEPVCLPACALRSFTYWK